MRVSGFDFGVYGACFRAEKNEDGEIIPLSCEMWSLKGTDDERYWSHGSVVEAEVKWADALGYEHVQFNRGKSLIEGFRALLIVEAIEKKKLCVGVNVSTLKTFAIRGRWSDADRKKKGKEKISGKRKMELALAMDHPAFIEHMDGRYEKRDDLVDAAWVCIWLLTVAVESE